MDERPSFLAVILRIAVSWRAQRESVPALSQSEGITIRVFREDYNSRGPITPLGGATPKKSRPKNHR